MGEITEEFGMFGFMSTQGKKEQEESFFCVGRWLNQWVRGNVKALRSTEFLGIKKKTQQHKHRKQGKLTSLYILYCQ